MRSARRLGPPRVSVGTGLSRGIRREPGQRRSVRDPTGRRSRRRPSFGRSQKSAGRPLLASLPLIAYPRHVAGNGGLDRLGDVFLGAADQAKLRVSSGIGVTSASPKQPTSCHPFDKRLRAYRFSSSSDVDSTYHTGTRVSRRSASAASCGRKSFASNSGTPMLITSVHGDQ
jgi:hypothetical protein